ncbi:MAG: hypothetical protein ABEJ56_05020 [Candidatus Nanohaloarchaea archaeon]
MKTLDEPFNQLNVSNATSSVKVVNLSDTDGDPVNSSRLDDEADTDMYFKYNGSTGRERMSHLADSYYYADIVVNETEGANVTYQLFDSSASGGVIDQESQVLNFGNMTVNWTSEVSGKVNPDRSFDIKLNVTDEWNDTFEDQAEVDFYVTNGSWTSSVKDTLKSGQKYENNDVTFDLAYGSSYVFQFNATNSTNLGYNDSYGSLSEVVETKKSLGSKISNLNASSGCNNESFFRECQRGTTIDASLNVTGGSASSANLTLRLWNSSGGSWVDNVSDKMSKQNGLYNGTVTVPDINTSKYDKKFQIFFNATDGSLTTTEKYNVSYRSFKTRYVSNSKTSPGSYDVRIEFRKYFTPDLLESKRLNSTINITEEDDGDKLTSFNLSDMNRDTSNGYYENEIDISSGADSGIYNVEVNTTNLFDETKVDSYEFNLTDVDQTFEADDFSTDIERVGNQTYNLSVENLLSSTLTLEHEVSGDIENFTSVSNGTDADLSGNEDGNVSIEFDVPEVEDYSGEVKLMDADSDYNQTVDIDLNAPECDYRGDDVCVDNGLNASTSSSGSVQKFMTIRYFRNDGDSETFDPTASGNISSYVVFDPASVEMNDSKREETFTVNYTGFSPGHFTGSADLAGISVPLELDANFEASSLSFDINSTVDLGVVPEGETKMEEIELENTGNTEIQEVEFSSSDFNVASTSKSIPSGGTETFSVEFSQVSGSGTMTVTASSSGENSSQTVDVQAETIPVLTEEAGSLRQTVNSLQTRINDPAYQSTLNQLGPKIDEMENAYQAGNYGKAQELYSEIQGDIATLESQASSQQPGSVGGQQDNFSSTRTGTTSTNSNSGGMLLPIVLVVFVLIVVGFVIYTSYIPEEGDPLYGVLGG